MNSYPGGDIRRNQDAEASAKLAADSDADGTGSIVERSEREAFDLKEMKSSLRYADDFSVVPVWRLRHALTEIETQRKLAAHWESEARLMQTRLRSASIFRRDNHPMSIEKIKCGYCGFVVNMRGQGRHAPDCLTNFKEPEHG